MANSPGDSYVHRAAALALVWSELLDDVAPAEECTGLPDLTTRRDQLRRELRAHLERRDPHGGADKWVQRAFWSAPPRRNYLDDKWKEVLLDWVDAMGLEADACADVILAVRSLFSDGGGAATELAQRRPDLMHVVTRTLGSDVDDEICRVAGTHLLEDSLLPMYLTDRELKHLVWTNRSLQALLGMAADEMIRLGFAGTLARFTAMIPPEHQPHFVQRQEEVVFAGRAVGHGYISTVIDLALRPWTHGLATPPWSGVYRIDSHAHFVIDRRTGARLGSMVVMVPRSLAGA